MSKIIEWIEALESDNYPQCKYQFKYQGGYCCLGVVLEIGNVPPGKASEYFADDLKLTTKDLGTLVMMNDTLNKTFPEIAQWLRENAQL